MNAYYCPKCGKMLFRGDAYGRIQVPCPRCKAIRVIVVHDNQPPRLVAVRA